MSRTPQQSRFLGLWTASWLFVLLLGLLLWVGDLRVQWPVLLVPVLWALVALRSRRGTRPPAPEREDLAPPPEREDRARPVRTDTVAWPTVQPPQDRRRRPR